MDFVITSFDQLLRSLIVPHRIEEGVAVLDSIKQDIEAVYNFFPEVREFKRRVLDFCESYSANYLICSENANSWISEILWNNGK